MFTLHRFPASPDLRRQWIAAVNRKDFTVSSWSRVCSRHFVGGRKTDENAVPALHLGYDRKVVLGRRRLVRHEYIPPAKKAKCMPSDESTGTSDDRPLDSGFEACAHKEPSEGAQADSECFEDTDASTEPSERAQADSECFEDTDASTEPSERAQADSECFEDTDASTEPSEGAPADSERFEDADTSTVLPKGAHEDCQQFQDAHFSTLTALSSI
ncbi:putative surface protein SACOL0050 [Dermacentor silvarum]|uniref:putative surface protein SACOL0050 n=1 Tax=Dermacentor silvarum TaxID=543639 RepID=UPI002101CE56|nr:putative surface protein SACOL0050 [Dermacentor silvarum]